MKAIIALALAATLLSPAAFAYEATVVSCHDGDTCALADGTRIRLHAIDAPELDQPGGEQARVLINQLVAGHQVDVRPAGDRSYRRVVADIALPDGRDVGATMVSAGLAWEERRWDNNPANHLVERQEAAQRAHLGLWADPSAIPPWTWRHMHMHSRVQD
jgi:micrococcal nuclease